MTSWLRAFFESIRHSGVAASLLAADPPPVLPHPGLAHALRAREAVDRTDFIAASDELLAFSGLMPGQAARRFLAFSWADADQPHRATAAAVSTTHPAPAGEVASILHALLGTAGNKQEAQAGLRPLFAEPSLKIAVLAALIRTPDAELLREFASTIPPGAQTDARLLVALWIAARRAGADDIARPAETALERLGYPIPAPPPGG